MYKVILGLAVAGSLALPASPETLKAGAQYLDSSAVQDQVRLNAQDSQWHVQNSIQNDLVNWNPRYLRAQEGTQKPLQGTTEGGQEEYGVDWHYWHERLAAAVGTEMLRYQDQYGCPGGSCVLRLTVARDRTIKAVVLQSTGSEAFNEYVVRAYEGPSGTEVLDYPPESKRGTFSYTVSFSRAPGRATNARMYGIQDKEKGSRSW